MALESGLNAIVAHEAIYYSSPKRDPGCPSAEEWKVNCDIREFYAFNVRGAEIWAGVWTMVEAGQKRTVSGWMTGDWGCPRVTVFCQHWDRSSRDGALASGGDGMRRGGQVRHGSISGHHAPSPGDEA